MEIVIFPERTLINLWIGYTSLHINVRAEKSLNSNGAMIHSGSIPSVPWQSLHRSSDLRNGSLLQRCSGKLSSVRLTSSNTGLSDVKWCKKYVYEYRSVLDLQFFPMIAGAITRAAWLQKCCTQWLWVLSSSLANVFCLQLTAKTTNISKLL